MAETSLRDPLAGHGPGQGLPHPDSYWVAISGPAPEDDGILDEDRDAEVAIIGGGYTGLSAAYFLAKIHGIRSLVLEANRIGWGCSGRNGGFARPVIGRLGPGAMIDKWGIDLARRMFAEGQAALGTVRTLIAQGIDCEVTAEGHLKIAHRPSRFSNLKVDERVLRERYGYSSEVLDPEEVRARELGGPESNGGLLLNDALGLNPLKLTYGVQKLAHAVGAAVFSSSPVLEWRKDNGQHLLRAPGGRVRARYVVIATNGYTREGLHASTNRALLPVLSHIVVTRPMTPTEKAEAAFHSSHVLTDTRHLLYYFRRLPDDRIPFGGRGQIVDTPEGRVAQRALLLAALKRKCPALHANTVDYDWCGWVCLTADQMPHVSHAADDPTVFYALGYQGSGVAAALHAGRLIADHIAGKPLPDLPPVCAPLPRFPLAALRRMGQRAAYLWYRFQDMRD